jgi:hypothetical protein
MLSLTGSGLFDASSAVAPFDSLSETDVDFADVEAISVSVPLLTGVERLLFPYVGLVATYHVKSKK